MKTVTIVWLDGTTETVSCHRAYPSRDNGYLIIEVGRYEYRHIPFTALREWRTDGS